MCRLPLQPVNFSSKVYVLGMSAAIRQWNQFEYTSYCIQVYQTCTIYAVTSCSRRHAGCLQVPLMSEIVQAWLYTSDNNMGIFDCHFDAKAFIEGTITDAEAAAQCDDNASSASPAPYGDTLVPISQVDDITAHHIWVGFFLQTWQVCSAVPPYLCVCVHGVVGVGHRKHMNVQQQLR